jgi:hypothetical protein
MGTMDFEAGLAVESELVGQIRPYSHELEFVDENGCFLWTTMCHNRERCKDGFLLCERGVVRCLIHDIHILPDIFPIHYKELNRNTVYPLDSCGILGISCGPSKKPASDFPEILANPINPSHCERLHPHLDKLRSSL